MPPGQAPRGLAFIKIGCTPLGNLIDHEGGARRLAVTVRKEIENLGHRGDSGAVNRFLR